MTPKSVAEIQIKEAIDHMTIMISKQNVKIPDAEYLLGMSYKVLYKCEELRKSRDLAISRKDEAQQELKELKKLK